MPGLAMENANGIASGNEAPDQRHNQPSVESSSIDRRGQEVPNHGVPNILDRVLSALPPELIHVTLGFFPFAQLICRVVQQSWIELNDLFQDIGDSQLLRPAESSNLALPRVGSGGKPQSDKLSEYVFTKTRLLEFVQSKRADFIKLLVLSEWSKHADEVSRLIDIQSFIHSQYGVYEAALLEIGNMKHDLIGAQLGNPDIQTALEVLSAFESGQIPGVRIRPLFAKLCERPL